jgi:2'-5' RNA ligase
MSIPSARPLRLFFALWPDAAAGEGLLRLARDTQAVAGGRATAPQSLHVTLAFLGNVSAERLPALAAAAAAVAGTAKPFALTLDRGGGARTRGGVAWIEASAAPEALLQLHAQLGAGLADLGFAPDTRRFRPHVTLARNVVQAAAPACAPVRWEVTELVLNASEPAPGGSRYTTLGAWPLGTASVRG